MKLSLQKIEVNRVIFIPVTDTRITKSNFMSLSKFKSGFKAMFHSNSHKLPQTTSEEHSTDTASVSGA